MLIRRQRGVNLIEAMIGLAIVAILLFAALPAFTTFMQNQRVRATAESIADGLQLARAEAVRRNGLVEFVLTDDDAVAPAVNSIAPSTSGRNWVVRYQNPVTLFFELVEGRAGATGSGMADATAVAIASTEATIAFDPYGSADPAATISLTNPSAGGCVATGGPVRCLNVMVTRGGQARMCDPDPHLAAGDTRKC